jgi:hypothetical protein
MNFHEYYDMYTSTKMHENERRGKGRPRRLQGRKGSIEAFYTHALVRGADTGLIPVASCYDRTQREYLVRQWTTTELLWWRSAKPYYNVHPRCTQALSKSTLNIPLRNFSAPFQAFALQFADDPNAPVVRGHKVTSMLVGYFNVANVMATLALHQPSDGVSPHMYLFFRCCSESPDGKQHDSVGQIAWPTDANVVKDTTVSEIMRGQFKDEMADWHANFRGLGGWTRDEEDYKTFNIVCSLTMLAACNDKIIEPHVLNRDAERYEEAVRTGNRRVIQKLMESAIETRRRIGFNVGMREERCSAKDRVRQTWDSSGSMTLAWVHDGVG